MTSKTRDLQLWEERARQYGPLAVGYASNPVLNQFEEELRWAALRRLCPIAPGTAVLDIGCGVGNWCVRLAQLGCKVVGADFSPSILQMARQTPNVEYYLGAVQDLLFPANMFDLAISITVLQHIMDEVQFERAVDNVTRMLKPLGHVAILEYSPTRVSGTPGRSRIMRDRSRGEWISVFKRRGYGLVRETGIRFIGYRLYAGSVRRLQRLWPGLQLIGSDGCPTNWIGRLLRRLAWAVDMGLSRVPSVSHRSDLHLFLFRKSGDAKGSKDS